MIPFMAAAATGTAFQSLSYGDWGNFPTDAPAFLSRSQWGAKPAKPGLKRHKIEYITIHHAGVKSRPYRSPEVGLQALQTWCQREDKLDSGKVKPAWPDIPYHYIIFPNGTIAECRDWRFAGDTNTEYDPTGHLLVEVDGNFEIESPTAAQLNSLRQLVVWLSKEHHVGADHVASHKDYSKQTDCPGKLLYPELENLRRLVKEQGYGGGQKAGRRSP